MNSEQELEKPLTRTVNRLELMSDDSQCVGSKLEVIQRSTLKTPAT